MSNDLEILKRLHRQILSESELLDLLYQSRDKYRVQLHLIQQPRFPERHAINIIAKLYPMDLIRVIKNKLTPPNIRKRAEIEFVNKYPRFPLGEKKSYLRIAPNSLLNYFHEENDPHILEIILTNGNCTEELILKFINRSISRFHFYEVLVNTEWYKRPQIAYAISHDREAPIRLLMAIIPYLQLGRLEKIYQDENTHQSVRNHIIYYLEHRHDLDKE